MKTMYNLKIADAFIEVLYENRQSVLFDIDLFEEKINSAAPNMVDECYLLVSAMKCGLFEMMIIETHEKSKKDVIDYFMHSQQVEKSDAIFVMGVINQVMESFKVYMSYINIDDIKDTAYEEEDMTRLLLFAKAYYTGEGVTQDYEEAYRLFSYLYEHGDHSVLGYLGYMCQNGLGIEEDMNKAVDFYERGALNHNDYCLYYLGLCYLNGKGCPKDKKIAQSYLMQSHLCDAYIQLSLIYEDEGKYDEAFRCYLKASLEYDAEAFYKLGCSYFEGIGVHKDIDEAIKYLLYAVYFHQKDAFCQLGIILLKGLGIKQNVELGLEYIRNSAKLNCSQGYFVLAKLYEVGEFVEKDIQQSIVYYQKAIELGGNEYEGV